MKGPRTAQCAARTLLVSQQAEVDRMRDLLARG